MSRTLQAALGAGGSAYIPPRGPSPGAEGAANPTEDRRSRKVPQGADPSNPDPSGPKESHVGSDLRADPQSPGGRSIQRSKIPSIADPIAGHSEAFIATRMPALMPNVTPSDHHMGPVRRRVVGEREGGGAPLSSLGDTVRGGDDLRPTEVPVPLLVRGAPGIVLPLRGGLRPHRFPPQQAARHPRLLHLPRRRPAPHPPPPITRLATER